MCTVTVPPLIVRVYADCVWLPNDKGRHSTGKLDSTVMFTSSGVVSFSKRCMPVDSLLLTPRMGTGPEGASKSFVSLGVYNCVCLLVVQRLSLCWKPAGVTSSAVWKAIVQSYGHIWMKCKRKSRYLIPVRVAICSLP